MFVFLQEEDNIKNKIIVYSDYICPFCFIGKKLVGKLQQEFDCDVEWRGYEIHPEVPKKGLKLEELFLNKNYLDQMKANILKLASNNNLKIKFPSLLSNSKLALEISEFAKVKRKFQEFNNAVFDAYWKDGSDIGDKKVLDKIVKNVGLDLSEMKKYIISDQALTNRKKYLKNITENQISGVPTFIINGTRIVGAQLYNVLKQAIIK